MLYRVWLIYISNIIREVKNMICEINFPLNLMIISFYVVIMIKHILLYMNNL